MPVALQRLRPGELLAAPAGLLLAVSLFLPWYGFASGRLDAWSAFTVVELLIAPAALAGPALTWVTLTRSAPALPVALGIWTTVAGVVGSLAVAVRLLVPPAGSFEICAGAWLGLAGTLLVAVAGWLSIADERPSRGPSVEVGGGP